MAQPSTVLGIFGLSPELYRQQQRDVLEAEQLAEARQFASPGTMLNPSLGPLYAEAAQQGQMIGQGIQGLLGVQDPQLQMIREVEQLRQNFDLSTPTGMREFAAALAPKYPELAIKTAEKAAAIDENIAQAEAKRTEKIKQIGLTTDGRQVYQSGANQFILTEQGPQPYYGKLESKTPKTEINMPGQRQVLQVESKRAEDLQKKIDAGYTVLERLAEQQAAIEGGMIGGSFADARTALGTFAATIGLRDPQLVSALANSKSFKANQQALAAAIAKQLGVNPTDKDFQASLDQFARNTDDPQASLKFIKDMRDKFGKRQQINENMLQSYIENDGTFRNYKGPRMVESFTPSDELQRLLEERQRRSQKKAGN